MNGQIGVSEQELYPRYLATFSIELKLMDPKWGPDTVVAKLKLEELIQCARVTSHEAALQAALELIQEAVNNSFNTRWRKGLYKEGDEEKDEEWRDEEGRNE